MNLHFEILLRLPIFFILAINGHDTFETSRHLVCAMHKLVYMTQMTTSHMRLRTRDHCTSSTLIGGKGVAGPSSLQIYARGTNRACECKMDVKTTWISYLTSSGSCFMVTWTSLEKPPLGGRLDTIPGDHVTTVDLIYFIVCEDSHE